MKASVLKKLLEKVPDDLEILIPDVKNSVLEDGMVPEVYTEFFVVEILKEEEGSPPQAVTLRDVSEKEYRESKINNKLLTDVML